MKTILLTNLPQAKGSRVRARVFKTVYGAKKALTVCRYATAAGDRGAINLWQTKHGVWRGERYWFRKMEAGIECKSKAALFRWLRSELPVIYWKD